MTRPVRLEGIGKTVGSIPAAQYASRQFRTRTLLLGGCRLVRRNNTFMFFMILEIAIELPLSFDTRMKPHYSGRTGVHLNGQ